MKQMDLVKIEGGLRLGGNLDSQNVYYDIPCRKCIYVPNFTTMYTILEQGKVFAVLPNDFSNVDQLDFHLLSLPYQSGTFDMAGLYQKTNRKPALLHVIRFLKEEWQY